MSWAEDAARKKKEEAAQKQRESAIQEQAERMSIAPISALWEKFKAIHKTLPREIQLSSGIYRYSPFYHIGPFIFIDKDIRHIDFSWTYGTQKIEAVKIFYNCDAKGYEICGRDKYSKWPSTLPFLPERDVEIVLKSVILEWSMEQLYAELYNK